MQIIPLNDSLLEAAIAFVARLNRHSAHNISYFSETAAEIKADFATIHPPQGYTYLAVSDDGQLHGLFGVEIDRELGRCWLLGPLVDHENWETIAESLYQTILADLPREITDQEMFFGKENTKVRAFAVNQGFTYETEGAVLSLDISQCDLKPEHEISEFETAFTADLGALHDNLFPNTYYSPDQLIKMAEDPDKQLFVHLHNGKLVGYLFIQAREAFQDGYLDFLGVEQGFRRQGIGRSLVAGALNWLQAFPYVSKLTLTIRMDDFAARQLYASLGFQTESVSQSFRKRS